MKFTLLRWGPLNPQPVPGFGLQLVGAASLCCSHQGCAALHRTKVWPWQSQRTAARCCTLALQPTAGTEGCGVITLSPKPRLLTLTAQGARARTLQVRRSERLGFVSRAVTVSRFSSPVSPFLCFLRGYRCSVTQTVPHHRKTCLQRRFSKASKGRIFQWKEMGPNQEGRCLLLKQLHQNSRWVMMR